MANPDRLKAHPYIGPLEDLVPRQFTREGGFVGVSFNKTVGDCATFRANLLSLGSDATLVVRRMSDGLHAGILEGDVQEELRNATGETRQALAREIHAVGVNHMPMDSEKFPKVVTYMISRAIQHLPIDPGYVFRLSI